jgi:hypothetical protein
MVGPTEHDLGCDCRATRWIGHRAGFAAPNLPVSSDLLLDAICTGPPGKAVGISAVLDVSPFAQRSRHLPCTHA